MAEEHSSSQEHLYEISSTELNSYTSDASTFQQSRFDISHRIAESFHCVQQLILSLYQREGLDPHEKQVWEFIREQYRKHRVTSMFKKRVSELVNQDLELSNLIVIGYVFVTVNLNGINIFTTPC